MIPVKIKGCPYIVSTDEARITAGTGGLVAACERGQSLFGYPNIIDIGDETAPKIIAKLRLEVSDPANCFKVANETPPGIPGTAPGTTAKRDVSLTIPTMRRCSLAVFRM